MKRTLLSVGLTAYASLAASGQPAAAPAAFEVASIKPTAPSPDGRVMRRVGGDPGLVDYTNVTLKIVLARAYGVKDYQTGVTRSEDHTSELQSRQYLVCRL